MAQATATKTAPVQQKPKAPVWVWEAKTKNGEVKKGEMEASDQDAVNGRLKALGYQPVKVKKKAAEINIKLPAFLGGGVSRKDLIIFTRMFSTMIDAGLPLVQCLDILSQQSSSAAMRTALTAVKNKVEAGSTFAEALRDHPKIFDELYVQLVAAGEVGGILDTILNRLATHIEKSDKIAKKVKGALTYPAVVMVIAIVVTVVLLVKVIPTFEKMFKDMGGALPAPTQIAIDISNFLQTYLVHMIVAAAAAAFAFKAFVTHPKGRILWDKFTLKLPLFGDLIRKNAVARFTRTMGTMISSGVPILDALEIVAKTAGNRTVESAIMYVRAKISEGKTIAQPLAEVKIFPDMVVQMIGVGEATGAMDQMLNKIADFYDDEVDAAVGAITSMIEPLMMVFLGTVVGGLLIAMYLPIFSIAGAVSG